MSLQSLSFSLVDVFSREPLSGNGLSIFLLDKELPSKTMQSITQEMRQFETIFLRRIEQTSTFDTRIFTMEEELPFAGHPVIGASAMLHSEFFAEDDTAQFEFVIQGRSIYALSRREGASYFAEMDQGIATVEPPIAVDKYERILSALNISGKDLATDLPLQVVSTGLPYLIVPITSNLGNAQIIVPDFETLLASVGAKFVYVFDVNQYEGRTWDNDGRVEDIATGSAAGPAGAYLVTHNLASIGEVIVLSQGRFLNRPSEIKVIVQGDGELSVTIQGQTCFVGSGELRLPDLCFE